MKINELINLSDKIEYINTSEAYSECVYLYEDKLLIPYVNLDIIKSDVVGNDDVTRIEFAYLILIGVYLIDWIGEANGSRVVGRKKFNTNSDFKLTDWFAINCDKDGYELKVKFDSASIYIPKDSKNGKGWWTLRDTPKYPKNINKNMIEGFLNLTLLPDEIKEGLKLPNKGISVLELVNGSEHEIKDIEED